LEHAERNGSRVEADARRRGWTEYLRLRTEAEILATKVDGTRAAYEYEREKWGRSELPFVESAGSRGASIYLAAAVSSAVLSAAIGAVTTGLTIDPHSIVAYAIGAMATTLMVVVLAGVYALGIGPSAHPQTTLRRVMLWSVLPSLLILSGSTVFVLGARAGLFDSLLSGVGYALLSAEIAAVNTAAALYASHRLVQWPERLRAIQEDQLRQLNDVSARLQLLRSEVGPPPAEFTESPRYGRVVSVEASGLIVLEDNRSGEKFVTSLDRIGRYAGEHPQDLSLRPGVAVEFVVKHGTVQQATVSRD
jgi:hypothetical protein